MMYSVSASTLSIGLSDLGGVVDRIHSPSLRYGLCWYRIGLSDLGGVFHCRHSPSLRSGLCWYRIGLSDHAAPTEYLLPAPTERPDTSVARRAMSMIRPTSPGLKDRSDTSIARRAMSMSATAPTSPGLKDRRIFPRMMLSKRANPYSI